MEVPGKTMDVNEGQSNLKQQKVCEPCQGDNITTQANGFCKECGECMCHTCFRHHLRGKLCRHHVLVDVDLSPLLSSGDEEEKLKCIKHKGETVRFYCRQHEVVGCGDCMIPDHNACAPESIKNLLKNFQQSEDFKTFVSKVDKLTTENKENEHTVRENKRINKTMLNKVLGDIRKFRTYVSTYLDKIEADIISKARQIISDNDEVLTKLEQDCKVLSSKVEEMKNMLNTEIYQDNMLFIKLIECKPRLSNIEQAVTQMKSKDMKRIEFVCNEQLEKFITSAKQLGTLTMPTIVLRYQSSQMTKIEKTEKSESENADETKTSVKGISSAKKVDVGARVRFNDAISHYLYGTGTVTAVYLNGKVEVKWDRRGTGGTYTVGATVNDVKLI